MHNPYNLSQLAAAIEFTLPRCHFEVTELVLGPEWRKVVTGADTIASLPVRWTISENGAWLRGGEDVVMLEFTVARTQELMHFLKAHATMLPLPGNYMSVMVRFDNANRRGELRKRWVEHYHAQIPFGDLLLTVQDDNMTVSADYNGAFRPAADIEHRLSTYLVRAGFKLSLEMLEHRVEQLRTALTTGETEYQQAAATIGKPTVHHWIVCGRIPGDDDDSIEYVTTSGEEDPVIAFVEKLYEGSDRLTEDWKDREPTRAENPHGEWYYVNGQYEIPGPPIN